jgi:hypothetical protein
MLVIPLPRLYRGMGPDKRCRPRRFALDHLPFQLEGAQPLDVVGRRPITMSAGAGDLWDVANPRINLPWLRRSPGTNVSTT